LLRTCKYFIDPSWSRKYTAAGDHFNRTPIEAIIAGCVPIARNLGIADNLEGIGMLFKPGINYHMIPWNATPKQFGEAVDAIVALPEKRRLNMLEAGRELLPHFDAHAVAQAYIDFAKGRVPIAALDYCKRGAEDAGMRAAGQQVMREHFGCT
jgi:glycosyltransferase involved in cell wall biosynthesis